MRHRTLAFIVVLATGLLIVGCGRSSEPRDSDSQTGITSTPVAEASTLDTPTPQAPTAALTPTTEAFVDPRFPPVQPSQLDPSAITLPVRCGVPFTMDARVVGPWVYARFEGIPIGSEILTVADATEILRQDNDFGPSPDTTAQILYELPDGRGIEIRLSNATVAAPVPEPAGEQSWDVPEVYQPVTRGDVVTVLSSSISSRQEAFNGASVVLSMYTSEEMLDIGQMFIGCIE